jgi:hypothetical protein
MGKGNIDLILDPFLIRVINQNFRQALDKLDAKAKAA